MRYFNWFVRIVLFFALLAFAVKNDQQITLRYFFGYEWELSLAVVCLIFFSVGVAVGVIAMLASVLKERRETARLKRDIRINTKLATAEEVQKVSSHPAEADH